MRASQKKSDHIERALEVIGDKWTPLLLVELLDGASTFCGLEKDLEGISPRTLSQRLDRLESERIIKRLCYCQHPPRYKYELTKKGRELQKVLSAMSAWGAKHG